MMIVLEKLLDDVVNCVVCNMVIFLYEELVMFKVDVMFLLLVVGNLKVC